MALPINLALSEISNKATQLSTSKKSPYLGYSLPANLTDTQAVSIGKYMNSERFLENHGENLQGLSTNFKLQLINNCIKADGMSVRNSYITSLFNPEHQFHVKTAEEGLEVWVNNVSKKILTLIQSYYGLGEKTSETSRDAALECARCWLQSYPELSGDDIEAAIRGSVEVKNKDGYQRFISFQTLTVSFFMGILSWYSTAKKAARAAIITTLERENSELQKIELSKTNAQKNNDNALSWLATFRDEIQQRKVLQVILAAKEYVLSTLQTQGLIDMSNNNVLPVKKAHIQTLKELFIERVHNIANTFERKRLTVKIALLMVLMYEQELLCDKTLAEAAVQFEKTMPTIDEFRRTIAQNTSFVNQSNEDLKVKIKGNLIKSWYQYAVETCDLDKLN